MDLVKPAQTLDRRLSVAPMMDWTDRHCRYFYRLLAPRALLYTEMVHTGAILFGDAERHLGFDPAEHPVALQLGGSEPRDLARAARIGADRGYDEINLNCGCPSGRVQQGRFGACLMAEPARVAECIAAMRAAVAVPVTVKCRIGIDDSEEFAFLARFVETVAAAGCGTFVVHARKAWLEGLSPKENREIPPLRYKVVHRLKEAFPMLEIVVNGGIRSPVAAREQLGPVDGVMVGREAYENPWSLVAFEAALLGDAPATPDRWGVVEAMADYAAAQSRRGVPLRAIARHMLGLFNGLPGARTWRRRLTALGADEGPSALREAAALVTSRSRLAA
ncbi:tRNA dihydrouridine(20/20a) synthase DusA [Benzoatithermus flavus]|uniref:tRNA-dihydrouridine(20/20a) synthase n=1 Tax=Benzoatithermus flavus TaxID=3108223 RepID=A0ABU8XPR3_9PROT